MMRMKPSSATKINEPKRARYSRLYETSVTGEIESDVLDEAVNVPQQSPNEWNSRHAVGPYQHHE